MDGRERDDHAADEKIRLVADPEVLHELSDDVAALWCSAPSVASRARGYDDDDDAAPPPGAAAVVPVLDAPPTPLAFLRDYVSRSRPCVIRNAVMVEDSGQGASGSASSLVPLTLSLDDVRNIVPPDVRIAVDVTPDGHGDCLRRVEPTESEDGGCGGGDDDDCAVAGRCFVKPLQQSMSFEEFCSRLRRQQQEDELDDDPAKLSNRAFRTINDSTDEAGASAEGDGEGVVYYSQQNDCLRTELAPLWERGLFPQGFPWAEEAFQRPSHGAPASVQPDAVNLWVGSRQSVSSMHKDHYENLFYVLSGEKVFTLCPPCDVPFLYERPVPEGTFERAGDQWRVRLGASAGPDKEGGGATTAASHVHWVTADVTNDRDYRRHPLLRYAHPITVHVRAGELLYLPALWFHRVSQTCETVAINYWYDMDFESPLWCYFRLLQQLRHDKVSEP